MYLKLFPFTSFEHTLCLNNAKVRVPIKHCGKRKSTHDSRVSDICEKCILFGDDLDQERTEENVPSDVGSRSVPSTLFSQKQTRVPVGSFLCLRIDRSGICLSVCPFVCL